MVWYGMVYSMVCCGMVTHEANLKACGRYDLYTWLMFPGENSENTSYLMGPDYYQVLYY